MFIWIAVFIPLVYCVILQYSLDGLIVKHNLLCEKVVKLAKNGNTMIEIIKEIDPDINIIHEKDLK